MTGLLAIAVLAVPTIAATTGPEAAHASNAGGKGHRGEPSTAALAGPLSKQKIHWRPCDFSRITVSSDEVRQKLLAVPGLACADITVPRNWHRPRNGKTITLRISKTATARGGGRQGIALVNPGGPGGRGLHWGAGMALRSPELARKYNFVGFDPRGVGDSTPLACTVEVDDSVRDENDLTNAFVNGCRTRTPLAPYITTEQTAYDMDFIRVLLHQRRTSYIGYSYGTWLGAWYASTFPSRVHRMLLDSSTDVSRRSLQKTWDLQSLSRERAFDKQLLPYVARHDDAYGLGSDPVQIRKDWEAAGGTRTLLNQLFTALLILPSFYDTSTYPTAAATVAYLIGLSQTPEGGAAAETPGAAVEQATVAINRMLARDDLDASNRQLLRTALDRVADWGDRHVKAPSRTEIVQWPTELSSFSAIRCQDGQWNQNLSHWEAWQQRLDRVAPFIAPFSRDVMFGTNIALYPECAYWPTTNRMPRPRGGFPKVIVAQSELDGATSYEGALATGQHLPGARMVTVDNEGSHGVFPYHTACVDDPITAYFLRGRVPRRTSTVCQAVPLPGEDTTFEVGKNLGHRGSARSTKVSRQTRLVDNWFDRHLPTPDPLDEVTSR